MAKSRSAGTGGAFLWRTCWGGGEHSRDFSDAAAMIIQLHGIVDWLSDLAVVLVDHMHPTLNTVQISVDMDGTIFKL